MPSTWSVLSKYKLLLLWRSNIWIFHFASQIPGRLGIILLDAKILSIEKQTQNRSYLVGRIQEKTPFH